MNGECYCFCCVGCDDGRYRQNTKRGRSRAQGKLARTVAQSGWHAWTLHLDYTAPPALLARAHTTNKSRATVLHPYGGNSSEYDGLISSMPAPAIRPPPKLPSTLSQSISNLTTGRNTPRHPAGTYTNNKKRPLIRSQLPKTRKDASNINTTPL
jgi:hypothetical protein